MKAKMCDVVDESWGCRSEEMCGEPEIVGELVDDLWRRPKSSRSERGVIAVA